MYLPPEIVHKVSTYLLIDDLIVWRNAAGSAINNDMYDYVEMTHRGHELDDQFLTSLATNKNFMVKYFRKILDDDSTDLRELMWKAAEYILDNIYVIKLMEDEDPVRHLIATAITIFESCMSGYDKNNMSWICYNSSYQHDILHKHVGSTLPKDENGVFAVTSNLDVTYMHFRHDRFENLFGRGI